MRPTPAAVFGIIILLGVAVVGLQLIFSPATKAHFQLDVVLSPAELRDPVKRDVGLKVLEWSNQQNRDPWLLIAGICNLVIGTVGLLAVRSNQRLQMTGDARG